MTATHGIPHPSENREVNKHAGWPLGETIAPPGRARPRSSFPAELVGWWTAVQAVDYLLFYQQMWR